MKKKIKYSLIRCVLILNFTFFSFNFLFSQSSIQTIQTLPAISIRALEVRNDQTVWFAANRGVWGFTEDGGKTWKIDSIQLEGKYPEFRSISVLNDSTVLLLSISTPAYLLKTTNKGKTWRIVFRNDHPEIFFDAMKFKDAKNGIAIADPIEESVPIIRTKDGGETWFLDSNEVVPILEKGTAFFASSNTNIEWKKNTIWLATGGLSANIWLNENNAYTFDRYETPLPEGEEMTGIYSMDFWDNNLGAIAGGNYDQADTSLTVLAISKDGGKYWDEVKEPFPMFGSCVQFLSKKELLITGKPGTFYYHLKSKEWTELKSVQNVSSGFHTLRISPSGKTIWLAGKNGEIGKITWKK